MKCKWDKKISKQGSQNALHMPLTQHIIDNVVNN